MKQVMEYSSQAARRNVFNELSLYAQAIWLMGSRVLARRFGRGKRGRVKSQAHYKRHDKKNTPFNAAQKQGKDSVMVNPAGTLTEIRSISYLGNPCSAELQARNLRQGLKQMLPAMASFCQHRWLVLVAPVCLPSVDELTDAGIDPARVLLIHPDTADGFTVLEQALRSGTCGAVLAWLEKADAQTLEHLRQAAEAGNAWGVLFRTSPQRNQAPSRQNVSHRQPASGLPLKIAVN